MIEPSIKFLHLTDIHFKTSKNEGATNSARRSKTFNELINVLNSNINLVKDINAIIVSGDIAYSGKSKEYNDSKKLLDKLNKEIWNSKAKFIFCPGNHDIRRDAKEIILKDESDISKISKKLSFDNQELLEKFEEFQYQHYINFRRGFNSDNYKISSNRTDSLIGYRLFEDSKICFLILNSSWFCNYVKGDLGNIYLGKDLIYLLTENIKKELGEDLFNEYLKVSVVHHPPNWYNWSEKYDFDGKTSLDYINEFSDLVFCGHEHGDLKAPMLLNQNCFWILGGATYAQENSGFYNNNCSLVELDRKYSILKRYRISFNAKAEKWNFNTEPFIYPTGTLIRNISEIYEQNKEKLLTFIQSLKSPPTHTPYPLKEDKGILKKNSIPKSTKSLKKKLQIKYNVTSSLKQIDEVYFVCNEERFAFIIIDCLKPINEINEIIRDEFIRDFLRNKDSEVWIIFKNDDLREMKNGNPLFDDMHTFLSKSFEEEILEGRLLLDHL